MNRTTLWLVAIYCLIGSIAMAQETSPSERGADSGSFQTPALWEYSRPLMAAGVGGLKEGEIPKDPSIVYHDGRWHAFFTLKQQDRTVTAYCSFVRWDDMAQAKVTVLPISDSCYYCAPQVFYFEPQKLWYLVYQVGMAGRKMMMVAYSTTRDVADPSSWTPARPILDGGENDPRVEGGLDYWIICDDQRAYFFFTNLNGKLWRMWTKLEDFPRGFGHCELALQSVIYEASHTYRLAGLNQYLTIVEQDHRRHYKAYLADRLDGPWTPLADTEEHPFAGLANIRPAAGVEAWTDNISHGELVRQSNDQTLTVDPNGLHFLFQGMLERDKTNKGYGAYTWRLGLLTPVEPK
ncbi:MAG: hypothetical protein IT441_09530 [Phycisphaeraceae bacterium]|nr:hypothetical protein [Phycisphaeraceae bacterium]